jgi:amino acid transporter
LHAIFLRAHLPASLQEGTGATWLQAAIALVATWVTVGIGVVRLSVSKWIPNLNAVVMVSIFVVLGLLGGLSLLRGNRPANAFTWSGLGPDPSASLRFLPVLVYNALGLELMSSAGEEMRDPQRDVPRVILLSGLLISVVYMMGIAGILISVPVAELSLLTGTWDALAALGKPWGAWADALVLALGIGFLFACMANIVTWSLGVNRVAAAAAAEGALPAVLGRLHPRYNTPAHAFVIMGVISSLLLVGNAALASNAANVFWMVFKLSGLCFLVSYLMVFPAFAILRRTRAAQPRPYRMPGGVGAAWIAVSVCWIFIALACVLFFKPSAGADPAQATRETWLLAGETLATLAVGLWLMPRTRPMTDNERDTLANERDTENTEMQ